MFNNIFTTVEFYQFNIYAKTSPHNLCGAVFESGALANTSIPNVTVLIKSLF